MEVEGDHFDKVGGAARLADRLDQVSFYYRSYVALASVLAEMDLENRLLQVRNKSLGWGAARNYPVVIS